MRGKEKIFLNPFKLSELFALLPCLELFFADPSMVGCQVKFDYTPTLLTYVLRAYGFSNHAKLAQEFG